jgi:hypothetical protein
MHAAGINVAGYLAGFITLVYIFPMTEPQRAGGPSPIQTPTRPLNRGAASLTKEKIPARTPAAQGQ